LMTPLPTSIPIGGSWWVLEVHHRGGASARRGDVDDPELMLMVRSP
jgi:hypothetical protein